MSLKLGPGCFYGEMLKKVQGNRFILAETSYRPGSRIPKHSHANPYFCMVLDGVYLEEFDSRISERTRSTVVFHPMGETHSDRFSDKGGRLFCFEIEPAWLEQLRDSAVNLRQPATFHGGPLLWLLSRLYEEFHNMDSVSPLSMEGLGLEVLAQATRGRLSDENSPPLWLRRAAEVLHDRFLDPPGVNEIAEYAGVHPGHLTKAFRRFHGCSMGDYVRRLRVEFASRLLTGSAQSLSCIGAAAGFSDQAHFSRTFKSATGMTPAEFRRTFQSR